MAILYRRLSQQADAAGPGALSPRPSSSTPTPLRFEDRVGYSYRIAVANIAEEVTNVVVRHGIDPRDFTLGRLRRSGPMLLPAALPLLQARRVVVPPQPGLFSALGLLSTDLVYYSSRSSYVVLTPAAAPAIAAGFAQMERTSGSRSRGGRGDGAPELRRAADGTELGDAVRRAPGGPIDESTIPQMVALFHEQYERRYGNRFEFVPVQGVTYRVQLIVPSEKVEYSPQVASGAAAVEPGRTLELRYFDDDPLQVAEYPARRPSGRGAGRRPRDHPRGPLDDVRLPAADGRDRPLRRDRDRAGEREPRASRPRRRRVRRALRVRPFHRDGAENRFGYVVEHMCVRLLTAAFSPILRDFYDFAATLTAPAHVDWVDPGDEQQHHALHRHDGRLGPERDRGVRCRPARVGRHHRRERPVPDGDARQRRPLHASRSSTRARSSPSST